MVLHALLSAGTSQKDNTEKGSASLIVCPKYIEKEGIGMLLND